MASRRGDRSWFVSEQEQVLEWGRVFVVCVVSPVSSLVFVSSGVIPDICGQSYVVSLLTDSVRCVSSGQTVVEHLAGATR